MLFFTKVETRRELRYDTQQNRKQINTKTKQKTE